MGSASLTVVIRRLPLAAAVAAALAAPGLAGAVIVPQEGMAGVRLGMSEPQVRAELGPPVRVRRIASELGPFRVLLYRGLTVTLRSRGTPFRVSAVQTTGRRERTRAGVDVGSPERRVRATIARARCRTELGLRTCRVGALLPGRRVTDLQIRRGRVVRVTIGIVVD